MSLASGSRLGPYEILSPLGAGGMGEVYRARDRRLDRDVAIKVLPERLADDPAALARFEREAKAVAALSHSNILAIHDFSRDGGTSYVVMELLEGESLSERLLLGPIPWRSAAEIAMGVAEGLSAAHSKGIIHRDLKPQNLFLTRLGRVKILDFGLARRDSTLTTDSVTEALTQEGTTPGTILGTVGYMSPEQVRGDPTDLRTDLFALGCVLHEMLTGQRAFRRRTPAETMAAILNEEPAELAGSGSTLPQGLEQVTARCLEKDAESRFQTARDLHFALKQVLAGVAEPSSGSSSGRRATIESIAVLAFANASGDPDAEYLSDGIAESIILSLSKLPRLRVMARSTISRYKGRDADPQSVSRELGVRAVLTGRVFHRGDVLVVKTELVDGRDGSQIWGENYSRKISDILAIEEEIAREICEKLRVRVAGEEEREIARRATASPEAYRLYLKGLFYENKRTDESLRKAIELFRQAIDLDPEYALAHAGIADSYNQIGFYMYSPPRDCRPKARAAAMKALELDPTLAEARAVLGATLFYYERDWLGAEREFRRAIDDNPESLQARHYYGLLLAARERFDESFSQLRRAEEIDPLHLPVKTATGLALYLARRYEEAARHLEKTLEMDGSFMPAHNVLAWCYQQLNQREAVDREVALSGRHTFALATLGYDLAVAGKRKEAEAVLAEMVETSATRYASPALMAWIYVAMGETDRALAALDRALDERDGRLVFAGVEPALDPLRSDPRFKDLLRRAGFSDPIGGKIAST